MCRTFTAITSDWSTASMNSLHHMTDQALHWYIKLILEGLHEMHPFPGDNGIWCYFTGICNIQLLYTWVLWCTHSGPKCSDSFSELCCTKLKEQIDTHIPYKGSGQQRSSTQTYQWGYLERLDPVQTAQMAPLNIERYDQDTAVAGILSVSV